MLRPVELNREFQYLCDLLNKVIAYIRMKGLNPRENVAVIRIAFLGRLLIGSSVFRLEDESIILITILKYKNRFIKDPKINVITTILVYSVKIMMVINFGINPVRGGSPPRDSSKIINIQCEEVFRDFDVLRCLVV